ncbi:hypothetical protein FHS43_000656 [Streptosporangium becharense]|uniref:Tetratricopeptide repeat protein n=1 Tax=Streptosporangium becharense TaxID=1816182 RepID=A0A7W9IFD7_9ACTN|nr:hypothetical protein [Streptosporangium becharense]MBB2909410.1 hypothetical protein [Streptosporangium becharense]MBB5819633.1 hypothetical protein [Streptosporangium becharense]
MERTPWWRGNLPAKTSKLIGHERREREVRRSPRLVTGTAGFAPGLAEPTPAPGLGEPAPAPGAGLAEPGAGLGGPAAGLASDRLRRTGVGAADEPLVLVTAAMAYVWRGEFARAVAALEEARRLCDARGERWARAHGDYVLSVARLGMGRVTEAAEAARESLAGKWRLHDVAGVAPVLDQLAVIAAVEGDGYRTARLQGAVARLRVARGLEGPGPQGMSEPRAVAERTARRLLGDEAYDAAFAEGHDDDLGSAVAFALT